MYPQYKSNRGPTPDTVVQGLQYLKASIKAMSIKVIEVTKLMLQMCIVVEKSLHSALFVSFLNSGARC